MMTNSTIKGKGASMFVVAVAIGFVLLFIYAATSKLLDFETFTVQLAQSPLLSAYAGIISRLVPSVEIAIAILLTIPRYRLFALYAAFTLMVMFTAYIFIILNFSDFIPCSCGGVLEKLSWTQHLIFNVVFILLPAFAVILIQPFRIKRKLFFLVTLSIIGISIVTLLFAFSEREIHRNNAFQRRYPHHPVNEVKRVDLKYNSYYIAGITEDNIYLGNTTAPIHMLRIGKINMDTVHLSLKIPKSDFAFRSLKTLIIDSIFYAYDGGIPVILKGSTNDFKITNIITKGLPFLRAEIISPDKFAIRAFNTKTTKNVLGYLVVTDSIAPNFYPDLLKAHSDPFFDTDGLLLYNQQLQKVIYVYFYRNEFVVATKDFSLDYIGKTIDTISRSQLDVRTITDKNQRKIGKKPIFVNLRASSYAHYLYIQSDRLGKFESDEVIKSASIIDVYDLSEQTYAFSFYLYHQGLEKLKEFKVDGHQLYALIDNYLITYKLEENNFPLDKK